MAHRRGDIPVDRQRWSSVPLIARGWIYARKRVGHALGTPATSMPGQVPAPAHPDRPDGAEKERPPAADLAEIHRPSRAELELSRPVPRRVMRAERDAAQTIADERQRIIALLEAPRNIPSAAENAHPE